MPELVIREDRISVEVVSESRVIEDMDTSVESSGSVEGNRVSRSRAANRVTPCTVKKGHARKGISDPNCGRGVKADKIGFHSVHRSSRDAKGHSVSQIAGNHISFANVSDDI